MRRAPKPKLGHEQLLNVAGFVMSYTSSAWLSAQAQEITPEGGLVHVAQQSKLDRERNHNWCTKSPGASMNSLVERAKVAGLQALEAKPNKPVVNPPGTLNIDKCTNGVC